MLGNFFKELGSFFEELFTKEETWWIIFLAGLTGAILVPFLGLNEVWEAILNFLKLTWWLWVFLVVGPIFLNTWTHWRQEMFKEDINWIVLELKIPRLIEKSSKAMEQVLTALHSLRNSAGDVREKYWDGEVTRWFSLEMVSFGGEIHFYVRCYARLRNLVEAAFFSYYPGLDIIEVPDYISRFPEKVHEMYEKGLDLWGVEMVLQKSEMYPIKTYTDFENEAEEKNFDPISTFLEVLGKLKKTENVGIQILIAAAGSDEWDEKYEPELKKLREPETRKVKGKQMPQGGSEEYEMTIMRSPGQVDVLKAVEENLSKPAFDTLIRFAYFSEKATFSDSFPRRGIAGAFNQYAALNLNGLRKNYGIETRARIWNRPFVFPGTRVEYRKARLLMNYRNREVPPETWMGRIITSFLFNWNKASTRFKMNAKCLATVYHIPTSIVLTEPHLKHLEAKKAGPPSGLAIFGEEEELDRYK
jgi:hypothetical protein